LIYFKGKPGRKGFVWQSQPSNWIRITRMPVFHGKR